MAPCHSQPDSDRLQPARRPHPHPPATPTSPKLAPDRPASVFCCVLSRGERLDTTTADRPLTPTVQNLPGQSLLHVPYLPFRHHHHPVRVDSGLCKVVALHVPSFSWLCLPTAQNSPWLLASLTLGIGPLATPVTTWSQATPEAVNSHVLGYAGGLSLHGSHRSTLA